jgi:hypothetical protein
MRKLFPIIPILLAACGGGAKPDNADISGRDKFIAEHYADLMAARKESSREGMMKWPPGEGLKFFNTLKTIGVYDINQSERRSEMADEYIKRTKSAKDKRIAEIEKSQKTYDHSMENFGAALDACEKITTEKRLPIAIESIGEDVFFAKDSLKFELLKAMNGAICACVMSKYAPRFSPQELKDYVRYAEGPAFMIVKNESYKKITKQEYPDDAYLLFYALVKEYNALDDNPARVIDASVTDYFLSQDDEKCLSEISKKLNDKTAAKEGETKEDKQPSHEKEK